MLTSIAITDYTDAQNFIKILADDYVCSQTMNGYTLVFYYK